MLPFDTTAFIFLSVSYNSSTAHFFSPLSSPYHQCKIPHPCRQRQMERAATAPCSAPMIYAMVAQTHTHTPMHSSLQYTRDHTSADEIACINMWGNAGDSKHDSTCLVLMLNARAPVLYERTCASLKHWQQSWTSFVPFYDSERGPGSRHILPLYSTWLRCQS